MAWRLTRKLWEAGRGDENRRALKRLIERGAASGVLAVSGGRAVAWCSVGPRADFVALETKRSLATEWDERTWSVTCFFVDKAWRRKGLGERLLRAAVDLARQRGATRIEGYPAPLPKDGGDLPAVFAWTGLPQVFERAGFRPLAEVPGKRPIYVKGLILSRERRSPARLSSLPSSASNGKKKKRRAGLEPGVPG
jgi:GNAT superfamily N-acetyltransferase